MSAPATDAVRASRLLWCNTVILHYQRTTLLARFAAEARGVGLESFAMICDAEKHRHDAAFWLTAWKFLPKDKGLKSADVFEHARRYVAAYGGGAG